MPAQKEQVITPQPPSREEKLDYPPPPGAPEGGHWERELSCGKNSWLIGVFLCCVGGFCVAFCPIDKRRVYIAEGKKYSKAGKVEFDISIWDDDY